MKHFSLCWVLGVFLFVNSGAKADPSLQFDTDVPDDLKSQVLGDFAFLQTIKSTKQSPLHQEIFGHVDGASYQAWFDKHVFYFGLSDCGGPKAVACVNDTDKNKIWVTTNYTQLDHPQIARLMTVFHEARHTESDHDNWPHAKCPLFFRPRSIWTGARLGGGHACDTTEYGSYASAAIMLNNISKYCETCSDKVKADAKIYSDDQALRLIDGGAIQRLADDFRF